MWRQFCKSKIMNAVVVKSLVQYEGSCGVDAAILEAADIRPNEWIIIANVTTGARFETYAIPEPQGSGAVHIYGAAAHNAAVGHVLIIMSIAWLDDVEARGFSGTRVVRLAPGNQLPS
jgi:aspartate 1-decarboxylase